MIEQVTLKWGNTLCGRAGQWPEVRAVDPYALQKERGSPEMLSPLCRLLQHCRETQMPSTHQNIGWSGGPMA